MLTNQNPLRDFPQALPLLTCSVFSSLSNCNEHMICIECYRLPSIFSYILISCQNFNFVKKSSSTPLRNVFVLGDCSPNSNKTWFAIGYHFIYCQQLVKTCLCHLTLAYDMHSEIGWVTFGEVSHLQSGNCKGEKKKKKVCFFLMSIVMSKYHR